MPFQIVRTPVRLLLFAAVCNFGTAGITTADDGVTSADVLRPNTVVPTNRGVVVRPNVTGLNSVGGAYGNNVGTATGDILEARGELAKDQGKAMLYRALSAEQLQEAFDKQLDNRRESVETYFELRDLNDKEREEDGFKVTSEKARRLAKQRAPERLSSAELDVQSGRIEWPGPLAAESLASYRRPIEESFKARSSPGEDYGMFDFYRVQRIVGLMNDALDTIDDKLAASESAALKQFLAKVSYEARFNSVDERIDY